MGIDTSDLDESGGKLQARQTCRQATNFSISIFRAFHGLIRPPEV
jgi:hypothetical protein